VALERLQVNDATSAARPPLRVALQLDHASPLVLRAGEVDGLAPWAFTLRGRVEPLIDALALDLGVTPWGAEPQLTLALRLHGVQPEGLAAWVPALRERVEVAKSEVSELAADLAVHLRLGRGGLLDFQPADGFGAEIELRDLVLQPVGGTSPSFGIEDVRVDVRRFAPRTGDLHIAAVEIENLRGRVEELAEGTKLGGLVLRRTPAESAPAPAPPADAIRATPPAAGVVRVDTVSISGLDFLYRDERRQPPVDLPLTGLEVDVRALAIPPSPSVPLMFQASVNAGNVALRERAKSSSVVHGLLGAVAGAVTGSADEFQTEQRAVFEELALQGRLLLGAQPEGQVRLDLGSLELPALAPFVSGSGVVIGDGLLDSGVTLRFDGRGNLGIDSRFDFTHLSVSEPANGPISTYLKLPAPLDSVLFALKNEADEHKVPLAFDIGAEGVSTAQLAMSATGALGQLIARAIAGAPLRAAGMVTGLFGVGAGEIATPAAPAAVPFLPGEAVATNELDERLAEALAQLAALDGGALVLVHELGVGDVAPCRAWPTRPPPTCSPWWRGYGRASPNSISSSTRAPPRCARGWASVLPSRWRSVKRGACTRSARSWIRRWPTPSTCCGPAPSVAPERALAMRRARSATCASPRCARGCSSATRAWSSASKCGGPNPMP
jgi:hypothetical protein